MPIPPCMQLKDDSSADIKEPVDYLNTSRNTAY
jgi:hypothetical protein